MTCFLLRFLKNGYIFRPNPANHLVKSFVANVALECLLTRVGQSVVFVVAFLVESFAAKFADKRFVPHVDSHVGVEGRAPIEGFAAVVAFVRLL